MTLNQFIGGARRPDPRWTFAAVVAVAVAMAVLFSGCFEGGGGGGQPAPTPSPATSPTPDPAVPPNGWRICNPGEVCGCADKPPGHDWRYLGDCPTPPPTEPPPTPGPIPTPGCVLSGAGEPIPGYKTTLGDAVNAALEAETGCQRGSRCVVTVRPQAFQAAVEARLRAGVTVGDKVLALCSGQHELDTDEISVATSAVAPREGFHIYAGPGWDDPAATGTVVWSPGADRGAWTPPAGTTPTPPPGEPNGCSLSAYPPFKGWTQQCPKRHGSIRLPDGSLVEQYDCASLWGSPDYCEATGQPGKARCPILPEGHPERAACERAAMGGDPLIRCERGVPVHGGEGGANPYLFGCTEAGRVCICLPDGTRCGCTS